MKYLVTGAGQIGSQLASTLMSAGNEVGVVRRGATPTPATRTIQGDAGDRELLAREARGVSAIFHCIHAPYDARAWRRDLPAREAAVMDVAAALDVPVVFPESVYAFGHQARELREGMPAQPCSPLGEVRTELLAARAEHAATTISVVASDLLGPTAGAGSAGLATVISPIIRGRRAWVLANPDLPHSWTHLPDLARAMAFAATNAATLAPTGTATLHCPTPDPASVRELAELTAQTTGNRARLSAIPRQLLAVAARQQPMIRELHNQQYLWQEPCILEPGRLELEFGLHPTPLADVVRSTIAGANADEAPRGARS